MFWKKSILLAPEDDDGTGTSDSDDAGGDDSEGDGPPPDGDGGEDEAGEGESDSDDGGDGVAEGDGESADLSGLPLHIQQLANLDEVQVNSILSNHQAFETIRKDPDFEDFFRRVVARQAGIELDGVQSSSNGKSDIDPSDMSDQELLSTYIKGEVDKQVQQILGTLSPLIQDFSDRKLTDLKTRFPDLEKLMPEIQDYRNKNPWAKNAPVEEIIKIVTHGQEGTRAVKQANRSGSTGLKPRGGSRSGKPAITKEQLKKMTTLELMELSAKEIGQKLE